MRKTRFAVLCLFGVGSVFLALAHAPLTSTSATSSEARLAIVPGARPALVADGIGRSTSFNWAGYVQLGPAHTFTLVKDTWKVPKLTKVSAATTAESDWVGIDGATDNTLVQDGTLVATIGGKAQYLAWTEILPAAEVPLVLVIKPGDSVTALVQEKALNKWVMTVKDNTTGKSGSRTVSYATPGESVEAIHERPCDKSPCNVASDFVTLAATTNVTFDPGSLSTTAAGKTPVYTPLLVTAPGGLNDVIMSNSPTSKPLATPSAPDSDHDGFVVADSSTAPKPPAS
jgi:Peptidase A4 family